eukprot:TRINITY_DN13106_c0_g1_i10.p1 TRINITY_DN13106_c0_g1~~TRINITY_DN13106_c0_g1_i10.p1  ORF type:complete len:169 (-),score=40.01 TRINITY_DN13106_c0_g1_i10:123-629(-)
MKKEITQVHEQEKADGKSPTPPNEINTTRLQYLRDLYVKERGRIISNDELKEFETNFQAVADRIFIEDPVLYQKFNREAIPTDPVKGLLYRQLRAYQDLPSGFDVHSANYLEGYSNMMKFQESPKLKHLLQIYNSNRMESLGQFFDQKLRSASIYSEPQLFRPAFRKE